MSKIEVGESIRFGWATFKKRPWALIGVFVAAMLISGISSAVLGPAEGQSMTPVTILLALISAIIGLFVEIGLVTFALRAHDNVEKAGVKDLWNPKPFWPYLGGQILTGIIVIIGFILLIIPGIIASLGLIFTSYLIIDKGMGPIEALKESWQMTKGHKWQLLLLVLAIVGLNIVGLLLLVVGLLVTIPVTMLAIAHAYRVLSGGSTKAVESAAETITIS